jgi:hypothetical protein
MNETNDAYVTFIDNNTIRGTYCGADYEINDYDTEEMVDKLYDLEYNNYLILRDIKLFDKTYNYNVTHSNTKNFIMSNKRQIRYLLDKMIHMYNKNMYKIYLIKEKIYVINKSLDI